MKKNKEQKFIEKMLKKMFSMVGTKYSEEFCQKKDWYLKYSFNKEQEYKFRDFFIKSAQKDFRWNKRTAANEYSHFSLMWGWTLKD